MSLFWVLVGLLVLAAAVFFLVIRRPGRRGAGERTDATVVLREERLKLRKTRQRLADVTARREVFQELKTVTVPVTREELVVERNGVEAVRIPLCEDRVDVSTHSVPLHEVSVYRRQWEENREIETVLKKEVARIEAVGDVQVSDETGGPPPG